jgi:hypothetical protein
MKLCVANMATTDMTPRPERVAAVPSSPAPARRRLESMFDGDEEDAPTTLYAAARKSSPRLSADHRKLSAAMAAVLAG